MAEVLYPRVDLLERLQVQQDRLNTLLVEVTGRLNDEQALHGTILPRHEMRLELLTILASQHEERMEQLALLVTQHEERMAKLQQTLDAIKDMLNRPNGH